MRAFASSGGGDDARVSEADLEASGVIHDRIERRAAPKGGVRAANRENLGGISHAYGEHWRLPQLHEGKREEGFDAWADRADSESTGQHQLRVQVTTAETTAWETLARQPELSRSETDVEAAVEAIRAAIARKEHFDGIDGVDLALDATDSPKYAFKGVADAFMERHGVWAKRVGYRAIWLVGLYYRSHCQGRSKTRPVVPVEN